ncbi:MAG: GNAT family N-acetyltransferase, partial [Pseudomonadota bacterium]
AWDMGQPVCDYHAPLMSQSFLSTAGADSMAEIWDRVLAALEGTADTVVLIKQPDRIGITPNPMASLCTAPYFTPTAFQTDLRPYDDFQAFAQAKRSSKARSRLRGKRNKLNRMGEVKFELLRNSDERAAALTELLFQKKRDLLQAGKRHIFDDPGVAEFLQTVIGEYEDVKLFRMSCGTQTVALTLAVVWHKRLHYFIATYHREQFGQCSPGVLALCDTFDWSLANGCEQFDFTVGDEPYKLEWSDQETRLFSGTFAVTPKGRIAERLEAAKLSLKHTIKSSPAMYAAASKLLFHSQR